MTKTRPVVLMKAASLVREVKCKVKLPTFQITRKRKVRNKEDVAQLQRRQQSKWKLLIQDNCRPFPKKD